MGAIEDLLGSDGVIKQLLLWNTVSQVISAMLSPAFTALQQDALKDHPDFVLTPDILARAVVQTFIPLSEAEAEAAKSGIDADRFSILYKLASVRLQPADLAEAVLRSYETEGAAEAEAAKQGVTADRFRIMTLLAGDGIGPEQAATALRRKYIAKDGTGPDSTSYEQAIAESRLHNKWADALYLLTQAILSPPDAADAVVRGFLPLGEALALAELNGVGSDQFQVMVDLAQDAPSPTQLAEALRREIIPYSSGSPSKPGFVEGIEQGRLGNKWIPMIQQLAQLWPTPVDALEARLVGQITTDESQALYKKFGGDPEFWQLLFDTRGESPTPLELGVLANRGYIGWDGFGADKTTFEQGFYEGRWRDKWLPVYRKLAEYVPPESTVVTLLAHGVIDDDTAADLLSKQGMTADLIKAYLEEAHTEALSEYRGATVNMVLQAYYQQILTADQAKPILAALHVTDTAAKFMLEYEDLQRAFTAINGALARVKSLYVARKIPESTARASLKALDIKAEAIDDIIATWQIENSINVKTLTETQIGEGLLYGALNQGQAMTELTNIGYTEFDAWVILCVYTKSKLPDQPQHKVAPPQGTVTPGTT